MSSPSSIRPLSLRPLRKSSPLPSLILPMETLPCYTPEVLPQYDLSRTPSCSGSGSDSGSTRPSTPAPSLSSSSVSSSSSPSSYLSQARNHPNYRYVSDKLELDLGMRRWGTRLPCYGREGAVEGNVTAHSIKHADRIVVTVRPNLNRSPNTY